MNASGQNGSTTTFVDVLIEQKTTTFHNNTASSIPKLKNETAVNNLFQDAKSLTWDLWNPHVLWLFCAALYLSVAMVLVPLAVRRPDSNSSSTRQLFSLAIMFLLASMGYLLQGLGMGHVEEVYAVEVYDGIVEKPGRLLWTAVMPPVIWIRHVSWALSSAVQLHILMLVASNPTPGKNVHSRSSRRDNKAPFSDASLKPARRSLISWELQFYVISINTIMHGAGLIGTLIPKNELSKWFYWVFGCAMFVMQCNQLTSSHGAIWIAASKNKVESQYAFLVRLVLLVWALFPMVWAVGDGSRTVDWEIKELAYILLDLILKLSFLMAVIMLDGAEVLPSSCQRRVERLCRFGQKAPNDKARKREHREKRKKDRDSRV